MKSQAVLQAEGETDEAPKAEAIPTGRWELNS